MSEAGNSDFAGNRVLARCSPSRCRSALDFRYCDAKLLHLYKKVAASVVRLDSGIAPRRLFGVVVNNVRRQIVSEEKMTSSPMHYGPFAFGALRDHAGRNRSARLKASVSPVLADAVDARALRPGR